MNNNSSSDQMKNSGIGFNSGYGGGGLGGGIGALGGIGSGIGSGIGAGVKAELSNDQMNDTSGGGVQIGNDSEGGDYEPTLEGKFFELYLKICFTLEIHQYALFLGMDLERDKDFFFIAQEGLKAPVPEQWEAYQDENDEMFYVNSVTKQRMTDHPLDEFYKQKFLRLKAEKEGRPYIPSEQQNDY